MGACPHLPPARKGQMGVGGVVPVRGGFMGCLPRLAPARKGQMVLAGMVPWLSLAGCLPCRHRARKGQCSRYLAAADRYWDTLVAAGWSRRGIGYGYRDEVPG